MAPLAVDVLSVGDVEEGLSMKLVVEPVGGVEGKVVVDEDPGALPPVIEEHPLVFSVAVVVDIQVHYILILNPITIT